MTKYNATKDVNKIIKFGEGQEKIKKEQEKLGIRKKKMGGGMMRTKYGKGGKTLTTAQKSLPEALKKKILMAKGKKKLGQKSPMSKMVRA